MEKISILNNIAWLVLFLFCLGMTLYEGGIIIMTYFQYPILHQRQNVFNDSLAFPAVTICSNNPANRLLFSRPDNKVLQKMEWIQNNVPLTKQFALKEEPRYALLEALYNMTETERIAASTSLLSLKLGCKFGSLGCINKWYISNALTHGNCFTFNHVTQPEAGHKVNDLTEMGFSFINELVERVPNLRKKPVFSMVIHPVGTAPVLHPSRIIDVSPGDVTSVLLTQSIVTRLPAPYKSNCVDSEDLNIKNKTVYYRPYKEYIYSVEACLMTCIQRLRMEHCACVDPTIPVAEFLTEQYKEPLPLCINTAGESHCFIELMNETKCNCPLPCRETTLNYDVYSRTIANEESIISHYNEQIISRFHPASPARDLNYSDHLINTDKDRTLKSHVNIRFKSSMYEEVSELPKLTPSDFLGFIGGNVGLWLGMSVMSIFDILKFASRKINHFWRRFRKRNVDSKPVDDKRHVVINIKPIYF